MDCRFGSAEARRAGPYSRGSLRVKQRDFGSWAICPLAHFQAKPLSGRCFPKVLLWPEYSNEPNGSLPTPKNNGLWGLVEADMTTLFSFGFSAIFLAFVAAAIVGHALLIEALVRPFFGRVPLAKRQTPATNSLLPQPAR